MTLTVTHTFVSGIADNPQAAAAGEVLPSHWNANHTVTGVALQQAGANQVFYVATTGSDSNPGTVTSPFRTIQHAVSTALSFDYQALYNCTINIAAGTYNENVIITENLLFGVVTGTGGNQKNGFLIGDPVTPGNVIIQPNSGSGDILSIHGGYWVVDGIRFKADTVGGGNFITVINTPNVLLGTLDFDTGTGSAYSGIVAASQGSRCVAYGGTGGSGDWNYYGDGAGVADFLAAIRYATVTGPLGNVVFNSAINLAGQNFFFGFNYGTLNLGLTFINASNVTGGNPVQLQFFSQMQWGADPVTVTFPGGSFDPTKIDATSVVDNFPYGRQIAGSPFDETTIYRGSWIVNKDTTNGPRYISYDDGGTIHVRQVGRNINTQTSTNYTLQLFDQDGRVEMNNAGANNVTVPSSATVNFPIGAEIKIVQTGAGATTPSTGAGATIHAVAAIGGQWKSATLYKRGADEWVQTNV